MPNPESQQQQQPERSRGTSRRRLPVPRKPLPMSDVVFLAVTLAFFAAGYGYLKACDRL